MQGCPKAHYGNGYCRMHWERNAKHGDPRKVLELRGATDAERLAFWSKPDGECVVWKGGRGPRGYGLAYSSALGYMSAHRLSYIVNHGPIPDGLMVRHTCDNPPCIRAEHLMLGDNWENMRDMVERGRSLKGEANPQVRIAESSVPLIRQARASGETLRSVASRFGISPSQVARIANRTSWWHIA